MNYIARDGKCETVRPDCLPRCLSYVSEAKRFDDGLWNVKSYIYDYELLLHLWSFDIPCSFHDITKKRALKKRVCSFSCILCCFELLILFATRLCVVLLPVHIIRYPRFFPLHCIAFRICPFRVRNQSHPYTAMSTCGCFSAISQWLKNVLSRKEEDNNTGRIIEIVRVPTTVICRRPCFTNPTVGIGTSNQLPQRRSHNAVYRR